MLLRGVGSILTEARNRKRNIRSASNLRIQQRPNNLLILLYFRGRGLVFIFDQMCLRASRKRGIYWVGIPHAEPFNYLLDVVCLVDLHCAVSTISDDVNTEIGLDFSHV